MKFKRITSPEEWIADFQKDIVRGRIRVGDYRVVYPFYPLDPGVEIERVRHRKTV